MEIRRRLGWTSGALPLLTLALLLGGPAAARAQADPPKDLSYRHHGPFVHLTVGGGARFLFGSDETRLGDSQKLIGGDTLAGLFLGWTVADNLMVHGQVLGGLASGLRGLDGTLGGSDVSAGYVSAGVGLTAYGVTDVFFTPMLGYVHAGWLDRSGAVPLPSSLDGIMTGIQLGKEWWIGRSWLAGLTGQLDYQWLRGGDDTWHGLGAGLLASLTYN
jgi:hypothetical protein